MNVLLDLAISTLTQGLIYALLSYGVYITYKILDFPDLTVDGSFPLGAAVTAVLLTRGADPYLTLLVAIAIGALAGLVTGLIHVRLHVRDLLAGIITMTALFSINLQIAGSNMTVERAASTIFTAGPVMALLGALPLIYRKLIVSLLIALLGKLVLDVQGCGFARLSEFLPGLFHKRKYGLVTCRYTIPQTGFHGYHVLCILHSGGRKSPSATSISIPTRPQPRQPRRSGGRVGRGP